MRSPEPRWATKRSPDRPTLGPLIAQMARLSLGHDLMPWQQHVADVSGELDPDRATEEFPLGLPAYRAIGVTVPRQSGKTTLLVPTLAYRAARWPLRSKPKPQKIRYAAQTRNDAMEKWNEHVDILQNSVIGKGMVPKRPGGREHMLWRNGSQWGVSGVGKKSGHGPTLDAGALDECWAYEDFRMSQAFRPAMLTIQDAQLFSYSTMGTPKSVYLNAMVASGREHVDAGHTAGVCYFEWSAEDGMDPADPATWWSCMPALGFTQTEDIVRGEYDELKDKPGEFERGFLNRATFISETIWPSIWWEACTAEFELDDNNEPTPVARDVMRDTVCLAIDTSFDRSVTSIGAAGRTQDRRIQIENLFTLQGTGSAVATVKQICAKQQITTVVIAADGPARSLIPALEDLFKYEPQKLRIVAAAEMIAACGDMYDLVEQGPKRLVHIEQPELTTAQAGAAKRQIGDAWVLGRKLSEVDITPLVACTLAAWAVQFGGANDGIGVY